MESVSWGKKYFPVIIMHLHSEIYQARLCSDPENPELNIELHSICFPLLRVSVAKSASFQRIFGNWCFEKDTIKILIQLPLSKSCWLSPGVVLQWDAPVGGVCRQLQVPVPRQHWPQGAQEEQVHDVTRRRNTTGEQEAGPKQLHKIWDLVMSRIHPCEYHSKIDRSDHTHRSEIRNK